MAMILKGAPVAAALTEQAEQKAALLKEQGIQPTLAILRVGERSDDLSYERGAIKRCGKAGINVVQAVLPEDVAPEVFFRTLQDLNCDPAVHGILMFRPLPPQLDGEKARQMLEPSKDVDGCTDGSLAGVFTNTASGFPPCTARAAMELLKYYGIDPKGKRAAVIGRSLVIGRPVAMLLMHANATITVCHTRTLDVPSVTREADLIIAASGQMESIGTDYFRPLPAETASIGNGQEAASIGNGQEAESSDNGQEAASTGNGQVVVDVGIGWNEAKQKLCGDVRFEEAEPLVSAITPVPGGVGAVTTAVLALHTVEAALRSLKIKA